MLSAFFQKRNARKARENALYDMVDALNALDYDALQQVMTADAVIVDAGGRKMEGIEAIVEGDRAFREQADRPQITIDTLDHTPDEVLVRGQMSSDLAEIDGPIMWRIEFEDPRIRRVEVTRPAELMSAPRFARQRAATDAS